MKKTIVMLIVLVLIGLLGWQIYQRILETKPANARTSVSASPSGSPGNRTAGQFTRPAVAVEVAEIKQQTIQDIGQFTGSLSPQSQFVVVPKVAGRLVKLTVNVGDRVKRDQIIAQLDDDEFRQQVEKAKADLEMAKASLSESQSALLVAQRELERTKTLTQENILSQSKLESTQAAYEAALAKQKVAQATVMSRETSLKTAQLSLSSTIIKATWDKGSDIRVVGERFVDEGTLLRANESIVSILDLRTVVCAIHVIERDYFKLQQGQKATLTTDAFPGKVFPGTVARIAPVLNEKSRQAQIEIDIPNAEELLKPGMFVRVQIEFGNIEQATVVPVTALVTRNEQPGLFVADLQAMTVKFTPVTVGVTNNDLVQIVEPPISGAVVTLGQHLLEDNASIVLPDKQPPQQRQPGTQSGERPAQGGPGQEQSARRPQGEGTPVQEQQRRKE